MVHWTPPATFKKHDRNEGVTDVRHGLHFLKRLEKRLCLNIHSICWWIRTGRGSWVCWDWAGQIWLPFKQLLLLPWYEKWETTGLHHLTENSLKAEIISYLGFFFFLGWTSFPAFTLGWQQFIKRALTILPLTIIIKLKPNSGAHKMNYDNLGLNPTFKCVHWAVYSISLGFNYNL